MMRTARAGAKQKIIMFAGAVTVAGGVLVATAGSSQASASHRVLPVPAPSAQAAPARSGPLPLSGLRPR
ncbi:hypothetical protein GCM10010510_65310 [Streptomyces anandii JCM 4720]|nr:hypothetical protein GCM10010510_65310 [Streptomyces anandii JCM 4720]